VRLSDFHAQIQSVQSEAHEFEVQIAQVDSTPGDDIDVHLSEIGWVALDHEAGQARLYPRSAVTASTPDEPIPTLEELRWRLPYDETAILSSWRNYRSIAMGRAGYEPRWS